MEGWFGLGEGVWLSGWVSFLGRFGVRILGLAVCSAVWYDPVPELTYMPTISAYGTSLLTGTRVQLCWADWCDVLEEWFGWFAFFLLFRSLIFLPVRGLGGWVECVVLCFAVLCLLYCTVLSTVLVWWGGREELTSTSGVLVIAWRL